MQLTTVNETTTPLKWQWCIDEAPQINEDGMFYASFKANRSLTEQEVDDILFEFLGYFPAETMPPMDVVEHDDHVFTIQESA